MNWELNIGSLLVAGSVIFSAGGFYYASRIDQKRMKEDINDIKGDLKSLNRVVMDVALQNQSIESMRQAMVQSDKRTDDRLKAMEQRWDEVRRGEGLITERRGV
jgi:hypothetical protein